MPAVCACCGGPSDRTVRASATRVEGKRVIRTKTSSWDVPHCSACAAHDDAWPTADGLEILVLTLLTCGIYLYFYVNRRRRALALCMASCARPRQAISYLGWHGTVHRFEIASPAFAQAFLAANAKKVVGADATARQLLDTPPVPPAPPLVVAQSPRPAPPPPSPSPRTKTGFFGPNDSITVAGRNLHGPLAYVMPHDDNADASTIITSLRVGNGFQAADLPYWPSYSEATPAQRAVYLDWLAGGRCDPKVPIGYVFIHFYGLERRVLVEGVDHAIVHAELNRLLSIYVGTNRSFRTYANALLTFMTLPTVPSLSEAVMDGRLGSRADRDATALAGTLAWFHAQRRPLPARYAWIVASEMEDAKRGAVVTRAGAELEELFSIRYRERFGDGLTLVAAKRPQVVSYHPGSPNLLRSSRGWQVSLPNVLGRTTQFKPLVELWNECVADLKKLSFARRDNVDAPLTGDAWLALPPELRAEHDHPDHERWEAAIAGAPRLGAFRVIAAGRLAALAGFEVNGRVTGARLRRAVEMAAHLGFAVEPDARVHARTVPVAAELAIWRTDATTPPDVGLWRSIHTMLALTLSIALADGNVSDEEAQTVHTLIANLFPLDDALRTRVAALRLILTRQPAGATALARKLKETRTASELAKIGRVLVTVAAVDGVITEGEHRALKSLYKAMGVASTELDAAIVASKARLESDTPVSARAAGQSSVGEAIPQPNQPAAPALDRAAIDAILAETREVAAMLSEVLDKEDDDAHEHSGPTAEPQAPPNGHGAEHSENTWPTLDLRYHGILRELLTRPTWTAGEIRTLASRSKLMPGAVLEALNSWSEEQFGDDVIEEAGDWRINTHLLERATA